MAPTIEEKVKFVREKCIEANTDFINRIFRHQGLHIADSIIRLADILLAIGIRESEERGIVESRIPKHYVSSTGQVWEKKVGRQEIKLSTTFQFWNLRDDDFDHQTDETKEFIWELLK